MASTPRNDATKTPRYTSSEEASNRRSSGEKALYVDLSEKDITHTLTVHTSELLNTISLLKHAFTSETCWGRWRAIPSAILRTLNELFECTRLIRERHGSREEREDFVPLTISDDEELDTFGAPLLNAVQRSSIEFDVTPRFLSVCPMEEAFKDTLHTSCDDSLANFIGESVSYVLHDRLNQNCSMGLKKKMFNYASESKNMIKIFRHSCDQVTSPRKKDK